MQTQGHPHQRPTLFYTKVFLSFLSYTLSRLASYTLSRIASYTLSMFRLFQKCLNLCSDTTTLSHPDPDPTRMADPNQVRGARLYTGTLVDRFFLRAELVPVVIQTISIKENHLHLQKNYHRSGVPPNLYTYTESHLLIQTLILIHV